MIQEEGVVVSTSFHSAVVETRRSSTCGGCQLSSGCGTSVLQQIQGRKWSRVTALAAFPVQPGDRVVLGLDDGALLRGSIALYGAPLAGLFSGALASTWVQSLQGGAADWPVVTGAALGLTGGIAWARRFSRNIATDSRYQSVILRKAANTAIVPLVTHRTSLNRCG